MDALIACRQNYQPEFYEYNPIDIQYSQFYTITVIKNNYQI